MLLFFLILKGVALDAHVLFLKELLVLVAAAVLCSPAAALAPGKLQGRSGQDCWAAAEAKVLRKVALGARGTNDRRRAALPRRYDLILEHGLNGCDPCLQLLAGLAQHRVAGVHGANHDT